MTSSGIGYEALAAVIGACFIIYSGSNAISKTLLQNRPAVFIGRISYSLYLWHWPIIVTLKKVQAYGNVSSNVLLGVLGLTSLIVLSSLSYFLIEKPFRKMKYGTPIILSFAIAVGVYFIAVEPNIIKRPYLSEYNAPTWHGKYYDLKPGGEIAESFKIVANSVHTPEREASETAFNPSFL